MRWRRLQRRPRRTSPWSKSSSAHPIKIRAVRAWFPRRSVAERARCSTKRRSRRSSVFPQLPFRTTSPLWVMRQTAIRGCRGGGQVGCRRAGPIRPARRYPRRLEGVARQRREPRATGRNAGPRSEAGPPVSRPGDAADGRPRIRHSRGLALDGTDRSVCELAARARSEGGDPRPGRATFSLLRRVTTARPWSSCPRPGRRQSSRARYRQLTVAGSICSSSSRAIGPGCGEILAKVEMHDLVAESRRGKPRAQRSHAPGRQSDFLLTLGPPQRRALHHGRGCRRQFPTSAITGRNCRIRTSWPDAGVATITTDPRWRTASMTVVWPFASVTRSRSTRMTRPRTPPGKRSAATGMPRPLRARRRVTEAVITP